MITAVPAVPLVNQIKARAAALGFDLAGITTAEPPARIEFYRHWVAEGCHGGMDYLARHIEKRSDPPRACARREIHHRCCLQLPHR